MCLPEWQAWDLCGLCRISWHGWVCATPEGLWETQTLSLGHEVMCCVWNWLPRAGYRALRMD